MTRAEPENDSGMGVVAEDNTGKRNVFPTVAKPFVSSPASEAIASQGLGGAGGGALLAGAIGAVLALAVLVGQVGTGETLAQVQAASAGGDSLTAIAGRIAASI